MNKNIAFFGFEMQHHVKAVEEVLPRLKLLDCELKPVIWSARDGVRASVLSAFQECQFIDDSKGWHGELMDGRVDVSRYVDQLTELEIKHFSYVYSRSTFFRDATRVKKRDIKLFQVSYANAKANLIGKQVEVIFFVKMPHSLIDLAYYFAAKRLGIQIIYSDGPFFGDYIFPNISESKKTQNPIKNCAAYETFIKMMKSRNLEYSLELPAYMQQSDFSYMPDVPVSDNPFFLYRLPAKLYWFTKSRRFARLCSIFFECLASFTSMLIRFLARYYTDKEVNYGERRYILVLLQYHPEQTTSASSNDTPFEDERVSWIAKRFPQYKIVVREHPTNLKSNSFHRYRSLRSLKRLTKEKNVTYIWPKERQSYRNLIGHARFTISTSSTVAFESIQMKVPSIHFCETFALGFPGVRCLKSFSELDQKMIVELEKELEDLSEKEIVERSFEAISVRPLAKGFLTGFHEERYTEDEYVSNAVNILESILTYKLH